MIRTLDLRGKKLIFSELQALIPRATVDVSARFEDARLLVEEVRKGGLAALMDQSERFDGVRPPTVRVSPEELSEAEAGLRPEVRSAIESTIERVRLACAAQLPPSQRTEIAEGAVIDQRWQPVLRVGLYVPGGKAVYPSSVVMNVVPAQVAGVSSLALASPPQAKFGGRIHPTVAGVASLLGVSEVYAMGGAGAIGAFAYGVPEINLQRVDRVTGPGNVFVAAAKRVIQGVTGIDAEAGPTDILVIADDSADPVIVAADLISQAEHDELAAAVLVTHSIRLAQSVHNELVRLAEGAKHSARVKAALAGTQSAIVLVDSLEDAATFSNAFAPEHLEIIVDQPDSMLALINNAGAIFIGPWSPVSLGDYAAGSNHVLPTGGQARFVAGLSVMTFLRPQQIVRYEEAGLRAVAETIRVLALEEDLPAHFDAVAARGKMNQSVNGK